MNVEACFDPDALDLVENVKRTDLPMSGRAGLVVNAPTLTTMDARISRYVDHAVDGTPVGRCLVLPGRQYTPDGPLLFFATQAALMQGWDVRQVWWDAPERGSLSIADEVDWVGDQLDEALEGYTGRQLVVGKSLGTLAATRAAARGFDAAWLTPLLTEPKAAKPLLTYPASQFVVIGAGDPYLSREVLDVLPGTRLVVPGDHVLGVADDVAAMVASHEQFIRAFDAWLVSCGSETRVLAASGSAALR